MRKKGATRCYYWVPPTEETTIDTDWSDFYGYDNSQDYPTAKIRKSTRKNNSKFF